jgi:hypothetical protein
MATRLRCPSAQRRLRDAGGRRCICSLSAPFTASGVENPAAAFAIIAAAWQAGVMARWWDRVALCAAVFTACCTAVDDDPCSDAPACRYPVGMTLSPALPAGTYEVDVVADADSGRCTLQFTDSLSSIAVAGEDLPGGFCGIGEFTVHFSWTPEPDPRLWDGIEIWDSRPRHLAVTLSEDGTVVANGSFELQYEPEVVGDPCLECPHAEVILETARP